MARRLGAQRSTAGWVGEQMGGLSYLQYIRQLVPRIESDWEGVKVLPCSNTGLAGVCGSEPYVASRPGMPGALVALVSCLLSHAFYLVLSHPSCRCFAVHSACKSSSQHRTCLAWLSRRYQFIGTGVYVEC